MLKNDRIYDFHSILNFRDFGNYPSEFGTNIRVGKLFRSANFHRAEDADLTRLAGLDIGLRVDLRYPSERDRQPNKWPVKHQTEFLDFEAPSGQDGQIAPHEMFVKQNLHSGEDARQYMQGSYAARPDDPQFRQIFSKTLKYMANEGGPLVIHCAAGKDRTGTLAAIILSCLGVDEKIIMDDYMMTMEAVDIESFLEPAAKAMGERYERQFQADMLRPMFGVEPSYLQNSLDTIGNMDRYIGEALGITETEQYMIKENYLC